MTSSYRRPDDVAVVIAGTENGDPPDTGGGAGATSQRVYLSHLPSGSLVVLEGTGAAIWSEAVDGDSASDPADLVDRLADGFGVSPSQIRSDVEGFLDELVSQGLLERS